MTSAGMSYTIMTNSNKQSRRRMGGLNILVVQIFINVTSFIHMSARPQAVHTFILRSLYTHDIYQIKTNFYLYSPKSQFMYYPTGLLLTVQM